MLFENKIHIKLILLGEAGVGKSAIIQRYNENTFSENISSTSHANFIEKDVTVNNQKVILELWDTVGQEEYRSVAKMFLKNSKIVILVYDVTNFKSFESLGYWYDYISKELDNNVVLGLAGNKTDLIFEDGFEEEVSPEKARKYAEKIGAYFSSVSAKESANEITSLIKELISKYLLVYENEADLVSNYSNIKLNETIYTEENKDCCGAGKNKKMIEIKMVLLGCKGVGKTSIIEAIKGNNNINNLEHTKKAYKETLQYTKKGYNIKVQLKDTNGEICENEKMEYYVENYKVIFLVFDIFKKYSFDRLQNLIKNIDTNKIKVYLLGYHNNSSENQGDTFDYENEATKFAKQNGCKYEYVSIEDINKVKQLIFDNI
jgi:small GTP-binding protein